MKYLIIISFTLRALVIFNFFTQMDDSALNKKKRYCTSLVENVKSFHDEYRTFLRCKVSLMSRLL
jgi:hypothetical protein